MTAAATDVRQFTVGEDDDGIRLDRWFQRRLPEANFNIVSRWARTGQLRIDGARATPGDRIASGQIIRVPPAEPVSEKAVRPVRVKSNLTDAEIAFAQSLVIHRDAAALVLNKPPGLATQGGSGTTEHVDGLLDALMFEAEGRPKLVHRLDKDTSGALLVARSSRAAAHFAKAFSSRTARKVYWAIIVGVPDIFDGTVELPLAKQPGSGGEKMHVDEKEGATARTRYRVIDRVGNRASVGGTAAVYGPHPSIACAHGRDRPPNRRGRQVRRARGVSDGHDQSQDAPPRKRRIRVDHPDALLPPIDVRADLPPHFTETLARSRLQHGGRRQAGARRAQVFGNPRGQAPCRAQHRQSAAQGTQGRTTVPRANGVAMHPTSYAFYWDDQAARCWRWSGSKSFTRIFAMTSRGARASPMLPCLVGRRTGKLRFHLANTNAIDPLIWTAWDST